MLYIMQSLTQHKLKAFTLGKTNPVKKANPLSKKKELEQQKEVGSEGHQRVLLHPLKYVLYTCVCVCVQQHSNTRTHLHLQSTPTH